MFPPISNSNSFSFQVGELPEKLKQIGQTKSTGYWQHKFKNPVMKESGAFWYVMVSEGRVVFTGNEKLSWKNFLLTLQRYVPSLRKSSVKQALLNLEQKLNSARTVPLDRLLTIMQTAGLLTPPEAIEAVKLKILSDFDACLFSRAGEAQFLPTSQIDFTAPIEGFNLAELIDIASQRHLLWRQLKTVIPSMNSIPIVNAEMVSNSNLTVKQKQRLYSLVKSGKTLESIAIALAKDSLDIAKVFAPFVHNKLVTLINPSKNTTNSQSATKGREIFIVDDSPILIKRFENLVTNWGYTVESSYNPQTAIEKIARSRPAVIFIDINMPTVSGFDLVKVIRRKPQIASIPLVILTAENKLSNKWRAQWSNCRFLTKPLATTETKQFQTELRAILEELVPKFETPTQVE